MTWSHDTIVLAYDVLQYLPPLLEFNLFPGEGVLFLKNFLTDSISWEFDRPRLKLSHGSYSLLVVGECELWSVSPSCGRKRRTDVDPVH